ncbi:MAG: diguanylate cyclase [Stagnimonas sp.]|nr:diguanylate cyclase [Stagnimonas sp.]
MTLARTLRSALRNALSAGARLLGARQTHWADVLNGLNPQMFVGLTDAEGRMLEANEPALRAVQARRDEVVGLPLWQVPLFRHSLPMQQQVHKAYQRALAGEAVREDVEVQLADGSLRIMDMSIQVERDPRGRVRHLIPSAFDVTESRRARDLLSEHLGVHRFHLNNTPLVVIEWDGGLRARNWPDKAEALFGWPRAEALGRTVAELGLIPAGEVEPCKYWLEPAADARSPPPSTVLSRALRRDGSELMIEVCCSVQRDADGGLRSLFCFIQDVSAREQALRQLRDSETRFRGVFSQASVGLALLDAAGHWIKVNPPLCAITGYSETELLATDFQAITHPDDLRKDVEQARQVMAGELSGYQMEKRYIRKDGTIIWVLLHVGRIDATPSMPAHFVSVVEDISARKAADERMQALRSSLERQVAERTQQLSTAITTAEQRNVELVQVAETTGLLAGARDVEEAMRIVGRSCRTLFPMADAALYLRTDSPDSLSLQDCWGSQTARPGAMLLASSCWGLRRGKEHRVTSSDDPLRCAHHGPAIDGRAHTCLPLMALGDRLGLLSLSWAPVSGWAPDPVLLRSLAEQIGLAIGNVRLREELRRQAQHDPLTGLFNRRQLDEHLAQRSAEKLRTGRGYSLLLLDLDYFKTINDRFGHEAGDRVLQEAAALFRRAARAEESVFRLGGEEFVMVLATDDAGEAMRAAERIRAEMQALRVSRRGQILPAVTVSIGVACFPTDASDPQGLLHAADEALYTAKRDGRNRCQRHDQMQAPVLATGSDR